MTHKRPRPGLSIRNKVLLLSGLLLAIPVVGYQYVREMETHLRQGLEDSVMGAARALAGALHERTALFEQLPTKSAAPELDIYVHSLTQPIQLDGYTDDWSDLRNQSRLLPDLRNGRNATEKQLPRARYVAGRDALHIYLLIQVTDDRVVYSPWPPQFGRGDHARLKIQTPAGATTQYLLFTSAPGWVSAFEVAGGTAEPQLRHREPRIKGEWQESGTGYNLELRLPLAMVGERMAMSVADVDDESSRSLVTLEGNTDFSVAAPAGRLVMSSPEIETVIRSLGRTPGRRVRVVDNTGHVVARGGSLVRELPTPPFAGLYGLLLGWPSTESAEASDTVGRLNGEHIDAALAGTPSTRWRATDVRDRVVVAATHPIWADQRIIGAVVVEETTESIQTLRRQALINLFNTTLMVVLIGSLALLFFATRISVRLRRLRDAAEQAVDSHGRVVGELYPSRAGDEIGDLSRSYAVMIGRLREYNDYLENMARRLSHEFRTPLAVVRSSLDNLELADGHDDAGVYIQRARQGLGRLDTMLSRMSEAHRLEQTLESAELVKFDLRDLLSTCVEGYRTSWPHMLFEARLPESPVVLSGVPDLIAQMLDKLVANAVDFSPAAAPIVFTLTAQGSAVRLTVTNQGPLLPDEMRERLFESMVSIRSSAHQGEPHLGLGLYIVKLIADFHGGNVQAHNLADGIGVSFAVSLPRIP